MKSLTTLLIAVFFFMSTAPLSYAITAADIELLISIGAIAPDRAAAARAMISAGTLTSGTVTPSSVPSVTRTNGACVDIPRNLVLGTNDAAVTLLQQFLRTRGHFNASENTTYFGTQTRDAVIAFQLQQGLITSTTQLGAGSVGPATIAKIKALTCVDAAPEVGSKGLATLQSTQSYAKPERGETRFRYTMSITPADDIESWRVRLICDADQISTNRRDLSDCGESTEFSVGSSGKKTFTVGYKNSSRGSQTVGVIAEALDAQGRVIDVAEAIDYLDVPGIRDLAPKPGKGGYRVTFTSSTTTPHTISTNTGTTIPRCNAADAARVALWSEGPTQQLWWGDINRMVNVYGLPANQQADLASRIEIVEPNNRTIAEIVEAYKDTHVFPTLDYVLQMKSLGAQYYNKSKGWLPLDETDASLERKRREIQQEVPGIPTYLTTHDQIRSNDLIIALGDLYVPTWGTSNYYAPGFKWVWHGREFGIDLDKYRIYNGSVVTSGVTSCGKLSNDEFDIILFKK